MPEACKSIPLQQYNNTTNYTVQLGFSGKDIKNCGIAHEDAHVSSNCRNKMNGQIASTFSFGNSKMATK